MKSRWNDGKNDICGVQMMNIKFMCGDMRIAYGLKWDIGKSCKIPTLRVLNCKVIDMISEYN